MQKLIITVGLPGSGKSTWAKKFVKKNKNFVNICKDDLRGMLFNGEYSKEKENKVEQYRNHITKRELSFGKSVIWSDTNLSIVQQQKAKEIAELFGAQFVVRDEFLDVSIEDCITNDLKRKKSVGERVIRNMYNKYLRDIKIQNYDPLLPYAIICDLDKTLALPRNREEFDIDKMSEDSLNIPIAEIIKSLNSKFQIIIMTARNLENTESITIKWLEKHNIPYDILILCGGDEIRPARDLKEEHYKKHIEGKFNILFALDDNQEVCRLWHELGINVLKVGDPDNF